MKFIKAFFKGWNWFEYTFAVASIILPVIFTIVFQSEVIDCFTTIFVLLWCMLLAKGKAIGYIFGFVAVILYSMVSFSAGYYGEIITNVILQLPMNIIAFASWLKNRRDDNKKGDVVIINKVGIKELVILFVSQAILGVGWYFMLQAFNTEFLIVSVISLVFAIIGTYLLLRRSEHNWWVWIIQVAVTVALWSYMIAIDGAAYATLLMMSVMNLIINVYGAIYWQKLKNRQMEK